jgi:hypothetical protein
MDKTPVYQFPDKTFCDISRDIWNFSQYLKIIYLFVPRVLSAQLKMLCGALVGKLSSNKRENNVEKKGQDASLKRMLTGLR